MAKLLTGFVLGVLVTTAMFLLTGNDDIIKSNIATQAKQSSGTDAHVNQQNSSANTANSNGAQPARSVSSPVATTSPDTAAISLPNSTTRQPVDSTANNTSPKPSPAEAPDKNYPPEIAHMLKELVDKDLQARYESDARGRVLGDVHGRSAANVFRKQATAGSVQFFMVDCRSTFCEIHALGYGPDALTLWNTGTADIVTQPWHDFGSMSVNRHNPQPDVLGIVLIFTRKPQ